MFYVTFMVNGEEYASVPVESGSLVTVPEAPQIEGYTFDGWITLSEGKPFDFNEPITSSVTLVAKMRAV